MKTNLEQITRTSSYLWMLIRVLQTFVSQYIWKYFVSACLNWFPFIQRIRSLEISLTDHGDKTQLYASFYQKYRESFMKVHFNVNNCEARKPWGSSAGLTLSHVKIMFEKKIFNFKHRSAFTDSNEPPKVRCNIESQHIYVGSAHWSFSEV